MSNFLLSTVSFASGITLPAASFALAFDLVSRPSAVSAASPTTSSTLSEVISVTLPESTTVTVIATSVPLQV